MRRAPRIDPIALALSERPLKLNDFRHHRNYRYSLTVEGWDLVKLVELLDEKIRALTSEMMKAATLRARQVREEEIRKLHRLRDAIEDAEAVR
jgi:hypothetical protein